MGTGTALGDTLPGLFRADLFLDAWQSAREERGNAAMHLTGKGVLQLGVLLLRTIQSGWD